MSDKSHPAVADIGLELGGYDEDAGVLTVVVDRMILRHRPSIEAMATKFAEVLAEHPDLNAIVVQSRQAPSSSTSQ